MAVDRQVLVGLLEHYLMGAAPSLTGPQIAEQTGIDFAIAQDRWRSLGFSTVDDDVVAFTQADSEAMILTQRLHELGLVDPETEAALIRTMGRSFARLAEWQLALIGRAIDPDNADITEVTELMTEAMPAVEKLMSYVWRRHLVAAGTRLLLTEDQDEGEGEGGAVTRQLSVGFADIVGYTKQSRSLSQKAIARLVDRFEQVTLEIVTAHDGSIVKTIGDEVLFVVDGAAAAAHIGLELTECHVADEDFPELRVGLARGPVLARLGDVFGPTVNIASRLTSIARPGRVVCDRNLAEELEGDPAFRLRRLRRTSVKGYRNLEPWSVKRPAKQDPGLDPDKQPGPASAFIAERVQNVLSAVNQSEPGAESTPDPERAE